MLRRFWDWLWKEEEQTRPEAGFAPYVTDDSLVMGRYADQALDNPAYKLAFDRIEKELLHAWKTSAPKDGEAREHLYYQMHWMMMVKAKLTGMVINMKIDEREKRGQADQTAA